MDSPTVAQASCAALLDQVAPMVRRYAYRLTRHRQEAEDLAQDTLLKVWRIADRIPADPDHRRAWLFRICRNTWISGMRRQQPRLHITDAMSRTLADPATSGFEDRAALEAVVESFAVPLAQVYRLHIVEDRPLTESARALGISRRTATRHWRSIRGQLQEEWAA